MVNCNTCFIAITFLISSIYLAIVRQDKGIFFEFTKLLNPKQKVIYSKIVKERLMIYMLGMIMGIVSGILYYYRFPKQPYVICTAIAIAYLTKLTVYYIYPKSPLMLYSLTSKEQTDAWAKIYEEMKYRYKMSLLIGLFGYILLFNSFN